MLTKRGCCPAVTGARCKPEMWEESCVTSLCPLPHAPWEQPETNPPLLFFCLSFYTLYLTSHYLFQTSFSVLVTLGPKEG